MTKLLEEARKKVRQLPDPLQDEAAEILLSIASKCAEPVRLDDTTRSAVREGKVQAGRANSCPTKKSQSFLNAVKDEDPVHAAGACGP